MPDRVRPRIFGGLVLAGSVCVAGLEVAAFVFGGVAAELAALLWAISGIACVILSVVIVLAEAAAELRRRQAWITALAVLSIGFTGWGLTDLEITAMNHEATQEVGAALEKLGGPGFGYTETSFLGYPNRQYMVASAPTLLGGRSVTSLRLGFAAPFVLGVLVFAVGLSRSIDGLSDNPRFWSGLAGLSLFTFPYVVMAVRDFEQVITPLTYTLLATGWLLLVLAERRLLWALPFAWFGAMLGAAYTPALSPWVLLLLALGWGTLRWRREAGAALVLAGVWLYVAVVGCAFLSVRTDVLTHASRDLQLDEVSARLLDGGELLLSLVGQGFAGVLMTLPLLLYLATAVPFANGWKHAVVGWWFLATVAVSVVLPGYASPPADLAIKRAITALPPVLAAIVVVLAGRPLGSGVSAALRRAAIGAVFVAVAVGGLVAFERHTPNRAFDFLLPDLAGVLSDNRVPVDAPMIIGIYSSEGDFASLGDFCRYLHPNARVLREAAPRPEDLDGRHAIVYMDSDRSTEVMEMWPALDPAPFAYELPAGGREMVRGTRFLEAAER